MRNSALQFGGTVLVDGDQQFVVLSIVECLIRRASGGQRQGFAKFTSLVNHVLAGRCVNHEESLVRRSRYDPSYHTIDLPQLFHQSSLRVEAPRGIHDQHVDSP